MSGLLAALMLKQRGWETDVYERVPGELSGRGAGIVAQPTLIVHLSALGLDTHDLGVAIERRQILDREGRVTLTSHCPQILTAWERVYRLLRGAFPPARYHRGRELAAFEQTSRGVIARFTDGSLAEGDVLIGADGLRSTVRQPCLPAIVPLYAGYVAWRAMLPESVLPHAIHHHLIDAMTFCLPRGEQFLGYPVAGPDNDLRPGRRRYNIIWYRPADESGELPWLLTDGRGILHSISIPPPLIRGEAIAGMREAAERLVAPQCRALVRLIDEPLLQPIYDLASPRLAFGRVALVGDAAFVARPHVAAGVSKAADDAAALAQALDGDDVEFGAPPLRAGAFTPEQPHHRARASSRRFSAGEPKRRGAHAFGAAQHSGSRSRRNGPCGFFARIIGGCRLVSGSLRITADAVKREAISSR